MAEPLNPYDAPSAPVGDTADAMTRREIVTAGRWRRFFNLVIDTGCLYLLGMIFGFVLALVFGEAVLVELQRRNPWRTLGINVSFTFLYYLPMEALFGLTIGKLVTGTRVVNEQGLLPGWGRAFWRTLARFIPFEALTFLVSVKGQVRGWHDRLPRTYVVRIR